MKLFKIAFSISIGIATDSIFPVGYNKRTERNDRVKSLFTYVLLSELAVRLLALLIVEVFLLNIVALSRAAEESAYYTEYAVRCFRIYLSLMALATVNKETFIFLQTIGKGAAPAIINLIREIVFGVFLPVILPILMGLDGLLWSFPLADILSSALTRFFTAGVFREPGERSFNRGDNTVNIKPNFSTQSCGENIAFIVK